MCVNTPIAGRRFGCTMRPRGLALMMSADTETLTSAIGRRWRALAAKLGRPAVSPPGFYGLPARQDDSPNVANERHQSPDEATESTTSSQAWLPIGPSCC
jgi:hypothetical protein